MQSFRRHLCDLLGAFVQLERGGPDACRGWLVHVKTDYVTLRSPERSDLHLPIHHIRSVTRLSPECHCPDLAQEDPPPESFAELLALQVGQWVRLYHSGPELTVGILRACDQDHLLVEIAPEHETCFALFHVRSLMVGEGVKDLFPLESEEPSQGR